MMRFGGTVVAWGLTVAACAAMACAPSRGAPADGASDGVATTDGDGSVDFLSDGGAIGDGAPADHDATGGGSDGGVSLSRDIQPFVSALCATAGCHDLATLQNHVANFSTADRVYARWVNGPGSDFCQPTTPLLGQKIVVVPGHPEESFLMEKLTSTREELCLDMHWPRMPPPPQPPLDPTQIELIRRWIAEGALPN